MENNNIEELNDYGSPKDPSQQYNNENNFLGFFKYYNNNNILINKLITCIKSNYFSSNNYNRLYIVQFMNTNTFSEIVYLIINKLKQNLKETYNENKFKLFSKSGELINLNYVINLNNDKYNKFFNTINDLNNSISNNDNNNDKDNKKNKLYSNNRKKLYEKSNALLKLKYKIDDLSTHVDDKYVIHNKKKKGKKNVKVENLKIEREYYFINITDKILLTDLISSDSIINKDSVKLVILVDPSNSKEISIIEKLINEFPYSKIICLFNLSEKLYNFYIKVLDKFPLDYNDYYYDFNINKYVLFDDNDKDFDAINYTNFLISRDKLICKTICNLVNNTYEIYKNLGIDKYDIINECEKFIEIDVLNFNVKLNNLCVYFHKLYKYCIKNVRHFISFDESKNLSNTTDNNNDLIDRVMNILKYENINLMNSNEFISLKNFFQTNYSNSTNEVFQDLIDINRFIKEIYYESPSNIYSKYLKKINKCCEFSVFNINSDYEISNLNMLISKELISLIYEIRLKSSEDKKEYIKLIKENNIINDLNYNYDAVKHLDKNNLSNKEIDLGLFKDAISINNTCGFVLPYFEITTHENFTHILEKNILLEMNLIENNCIYEELKNNNLHNSNIKSKTELNCLDNSKISNLNENEYSNLLRLTLISNFSKKNKNSLINNANYQTNLPEYTYKRNNIEILEPDSNKKNIIDIGINNNEALKSNKNENNTTKYKYSYNDICSNTVFSSDDLSYNRSSSSDSKKLKYISCRKKTNKKRKFSYSSQDLLNNNNNNNSNLLETLNIKSKSKEKVKVKDNKCTNMFSNIKNNSSISILFNKYNETNTNKEEKINLLSNIKFSKYNVNSNEEDVTNNKNVKICKKNILIITDNAVSQSRLLYLFKYYREKKIDYTANSFKYILNNFNTFKEFIRNKNINNNDIINNNSCKNKDSKDNGSKKSIKNEDLDLQLKSYYNFLKNSPNIEHNIDNNINTDNNHNEANKFIKYTLLYYKAKSIVLNTLKENKTLYNDIFNEKSIYNPYIELDDIAFDDIKEYLINKNYLENEQDEFSYRLESKDLDNINVKLFVSVKIIDYKNTNCYINYIRNNENKVDYALFYKLDIEMLKILIYFNKNLINNCTTFNRIIILNSLYNRFSLIKTISNVDTSNEFSEISSINTKNCNSIVFKDMDLLKQISIFKIEKKLKDNLMKLNIDTFLSFNNLKIKKNSLDYVAKKHFKNYVRKYNVNINNVYNNDSNNYLNSVDSTTKEYSFEIFPIKKLNKSTVDSKLSNIFVDNREMSSNLPLELSKVFNVYYSQLTVGDYIISNNTCIERKCINTGDLFQSINNNRLQDQIINMKNFFQNTFLLFEFNYGNLGNNLFNSANQILYKKLFEIVEASDFTLNFIYSYSIDFTKHIFEKLKNIVSDSNLNVKDCSIISKNNKSDIINALEIKESLLNKSKDKTNVHNYILKKLDIYDASLNENISYFGTELLDKVKEFKNYVINLINIDSNNNIKSNNDQEYCFNNNIITNDIQIDNQDNLNSINLNQEVYKKTDSSNKVNFRHIHEKMLNRIEGINNKNIHYVFSNYKNLADFFTSSIDKLHNIFGENEGTKIYNFLNYNINDNSDDNIYYNEESLNNSLNN